MTNKNVSAPAVLLAAALLGACGGGGGGGAGSGAGRSEPEVGSVSADRAEVSVSATTDSAPQTASVRLTLRDRAAGKAAWVGVSISGPAVSSVDFVQISSNEADVVMSMASPGGLGVGSFSSTVRIAVCDDDLCQKHLRGSPISVAVSYLIAPGTGTPPPPPPPPGPGAEPGFPAPTVLSRIALGHDVVDAEYSNALDAVVMVSSYPQNALHLYDVETGRTRSLPLNKVPTAVSVAPDGRHAAVGHDALVTYVDLAAVLQEQPLAPVLLNVSAKVFDLVLAGNGYVHVFPLVDQWVNVHSIEIATNVETLGQGTTRERTRARLHSGGEWIYAANNGLSPDDIEKYDISAGVSRRLNDSPYHGTYMMCGNLWMSPGGSRIYTACGNVFRSSAVESEDMTYSGSLQLGATGADYGSQIRSLSEAPQAGEIVLLAEDNYLCASFGDPNRCYTRVGVFENAFLNRSTLYSLPPVTVAGNAYSQRGLFVFHSADGDRRFLLTRLIGMPNPDAEYYLTEID